MLVFQHWNIKYPGWLTSPNSLKKNPDTWCWYPNLFWPAVRYMSDVVEEKVQFFPLKCNGIEIAEIGNTQVQYFKVVQYWSKCTLLLSTTALCTWTHGHSSPIRRTTTVWTTQICPNGDYAILCTDPNFVNMYESKYGTPSYSPLVTVWSIISPSELLMWSVEP